MILDVVICALLCVAVLTIIWCLAGWCLLPLSGRQLTLFFADDREGALERQLRSNEWLRAAGLSRGQVIIICDELNAAVRRDAEVFASGRSYLQILTRAQLHTILEMENEHGRAGRTDAPGNGTERTVSESGKWV